MSLKNFYANPYYNIRAFALQAIAAGVACAALYSLRSPEFFAFEVSWWQPLVYGALGIYLGGLSAVWIHNATHKSFSSPIVNEACGTLAGLHQLWGFNGWRLIHLVHHQYSDNVEHDPHPPRGRSFWKFAREMFIQSSFTISKRYVDHWKNTPRTRLLQSLALVTFFIASTATLAAWFLLLGPVAFVFGYIPSLIANHLLFVDVNYSCHPADEKGETAAANLNNNLYHKLANFFWHGIYFHGNHHRRPMLFNPRYMPERNTKDETPESEMKEAA